MALFSIRAVAALACATLVACGGGGDVDATVSTDGETVSGSFAACAPVGEPIAIASTRTVLLLTGTTLGLSVRTHLGTRCAGPAIAVIDFPVIDLTDDGTQLVAGPPSGPPTLTAWRVTLRRNAGQVTWQGDSRYLRVVNGRVEVFEPSSGLLLYSERVELPALADKSLLGLVGNRIYLGNTLYDSQGYPQGLDFSAGWDRL